MWCIISGGSLRNFTRDIKMGWMNRAKKKYLQSKHSQYVSFRTKYFNDGLVRYKEIPELEPCSECTNNILTLPLKAFTTLSCGHIFHRSCIEKQLLHTKPGACPFPNCGKNVNVIVDSNSTRRGSQSSQSSGISIISNLMSEKILLTSPTIPEDPMEDVENTLIQETTTRLTCAKCAEEITADFPKDTVFCPVNMPCIMIALTIHTKSVLPAQPKIRNCFQWKRHRIRPRNALVIYRTILI
ncbi:hypothetical protein C1646_676082 [Rhizophagus diaphanus]|nr:hypothetical protein C1646_676082 [Rhizophagus diaphanus] [Rhizophagus sp. MUCL 43196]